MKTLLVVGWFLCQGVFCEIVDKLSRHAGTDLKKEVLLVSWQFIHSVSFIKTKFKKMQ